MCCILSHGHCAGVEFDVEVEVWKSRWLFGVSGMRRECDGLAEGGLPGAWDWDWFWSLG